MKTMSDGGGVPVPSSVTVPLMVQPDALAQTATRLEAVADNLEACVARTSGKLGPTAPGHDEVSTLSALGFAAQGMNASMEIAHSIAQLRKAANDCRESAKRYRQTDESFGASL